MIAPYGPRFVVLTAPRSGSTWLIETLNNFSDTTVYTELFLPRKKTRDQRSMSWKTAEYLDRNLRAYPLFCEVASTSLSIRPFSVVAYLNELYRRPGATGFKCMYSNLLRYPELWSYIVLRRLRVVHLVRQNHLNVVISDRMRWATGTVHRMVGEPAGAPRSIELDPARLIRLMGRSQRNTSMVRLLLRLCNLLSIEVVYEDLVRNPGGFDVLCEFLSINPERRKPQSKLAKLVQGRHEDIIRNYDEVKKALAGTEFASLLD